MIAEDRLVKIRQKLHSLPEISGREKETSAFIKEMLQATEPDQVLEGVGGHGLIAIYNGIKPEAGSNLMIRAELDGLPVTEQTGLPYQSEHSGRMHACGHDGHMAILLGIAEKLKEQRPESGSVLLLFQPSEETGEGAGRILQDEKFKQLKIDRAAALHNLPGFDENTLYIRSGTFASASVGYKVTFRGKTSHAAYPEEGINPGSDIAEFVQAVNKLHNDYIYIDKITAATVTYLKLGEEAFGISPGTGEAGATLRAETDELLNEMRNRLEEKLESLKSKFEGELIYVEAEPFAAVVNDEAGVSHFQKALGDSGRFTLKDLPAPFPWSEDFGEFCSKFPVTFFGIGAGRQSDPLHSEKYDFNDRLLSTGVEAFWKLIEHYTKLPNDG